ncbi:hypothetical protein SSS_00393 [Sarcoptes scabiei]|uniref:Uncharacterized protein n=1 Tax=Sarcoptes scabiei TaxID=52283 RepID=A0A834VFI2_SARSC|nr:hypothetical protein SSS_00393 [Sarcoptes scabiei]
MTKERQERAAIIWTIRNLARQKNQLLSAIEIRLRDLRSRLPSGQVEPDDERQFRRVEQISELVVEAAKIFFTSIGFYFREFDSIENRKRLNALAILFISLLDDFEEPHRLINWSLSNADKNVPSQISLLRPIYREFHQLLLKVMEYVRKLEALRDSDNFESLLEDFNAQQK